jgi:hypothetical protein
MFIYSMSKICGFHCGGSEECRHLRRYAMWQELLVIAYIIPRSLILSTLMMEAIRSSETSVLTGVTPCHTPEDSILYIPRYSVYV